jgi:hypothetical protein
MRSLLITAAALCVLFVSTPARAQLFVSGGGTTVTANAGTNLNTSALALESGGNLATTATQTTTTASNVAETHGTPGATAPAKAEVLAATDASQNTQFLKASTLGLVVVTQPLSPERGGVPLLRSPFPCNALRRSNCS